MGRATDNAHVICNKCSHVAEWHEMIALVVVTLNLLLTVYVKHGRLQRLDSLLSTVMVPLTAIGLTGVLVCR